MTVGVPCEPSPTPSAVPFEGGGVGRILEVIRFRGDHLIVLTRGRFGEAVEGGPAEEAAAEVSVPPPFGRSEVDGKSSALKFEVDDLRDMFSNPADVDGEGYRGGLVCFWFGFDGNSSNAVL